MNKVRNKINGKIGVFNPHEDNDSGVVVYALPEKEYEIAGPKIATYKTRKGFWQRWEVIK